MFYAPGFGWALYCFTFSSTIMLPFDSFIKTFAGLCYLRSVVCDLCDEYDVLPCEVSVCEAVDVARRWYSCECERGRY